MTPQLGYVKEIQKRLKEAEDSLLALQSTEIQAAQLSASEYFQKREEGESQDYISRETLIQMN